MIEDRVTALEADLRRLREKFERMWASFRTWEGANKDKIVAASLERAARIAEGAKEEAENMPPSWNDACSYIAQQVRKTQA